MYIYPHKYCHTCLRNDSRVFAAARVLAQAAEVFTIDTKHIFIAHDQVGRCAVCSSVMFINGEPFLKREKQSTQDHKRVVFETLHYLSFVFITLVFRSAFWMVYPVISQLPSSLGGSHSRAALKPHTSVTRTFRGGPGFSVQINTLHNCETVINYK